MDWQDHNKINILNRNLEESNRLAKADLDSKGYYDIKNDLKNKVITVLGYGTASGILGYCIYLASRIGR